MHFMSPTLPTFTSVRPHWFCIYGNNLSEDMRQSMLSVGFLITFLLCLMSWLPTDLKCEVGCELNRFNGEIKEYIQNEVELTNENNKEIKCQ